MRTTSRYSSHADASLPSASWQSARRSKVPPAGSRRSLSPKAAHASEVRPWSISCLPRSNSASAAIGSRGASCARAGDAEEEHGDGQQNPSTGHPSQPTLPRSNCRPVEGARRGGGAEGWQGRAEGRARGSTRRARRSGGAREAVGGGDEGEEQGRHLDRGGLLRAKHREDEGRDHDERDRAQGDDEARGGAFPSPGGDRGPGARPPRARRRCRTAPARRRGRPPTRIDRPATWPDSAARLTRARSALRASAREVPPARRRGPTPSPSPRSSPHRTAPSPSPAGTR